MYIPYVKTWQVIFIVSTMHQVIAEIKTAEFTLVDCKLPEGGQALNGEEQFQSVNVSSPMECAVKCSALEGCVSLNHYKGKLQIISMVLLKLTFAVVL